MKKKTGFYSTTSFQQVFKFCFKLPFLGKYQFIIKKEKLNWFGKKINASMAHGPSAGMIGDLHAVRFIETRPTKLPPYKKVGPVVFGMQEIKLKTKRTAKHP